MLLLEQYRALREATAIVDRSSLGRLRLTGADRRAYLQGLLTNDIDALEPGQGCYAAYLTAQGRMIADMRVFETGGSLIVDLDAALAGPVRERWETFVFSEDVQIADVSAETAETGIYGPGAARALAGALAPLNRSPERPDADRLNSMPMLGNWRFDTAAGDALLVRSDDAGVTGFDVILPRGLGPELERSLRGSGAVDVDAETIETGRIEAGRPRFHADMDETTIPLEAGIEERAISLTKGCYVGQEIIIRVLHRGHGRVARRLVGLTFDPDAPVPARGDRLRAGDREIGSITSAVRSPSLDRPIALGYVHRDFSEPETRVEAVHDGKPLLAVVARMPFVP